MRTTDTNEFDKMIEEATLDCYDEEEVFMGILYTLEANLSFPFPAKALGETVEVIGIDDANSSMGRGILAVVTKGGRQYTIGVAELELSPYDAKNGKWLEMFHYWLERY